MKELIRTKHSSLETASSKIKWKVSDNLFTHLARFAYLDAAILVDLLSVISGVFASRDKARDLWHLNISK